MQWVNPDFSELVEHAEKALLGRTVEMANCTNCNGMGRHIYTDPKTKKPKDRPCLACSGSGQK